MSKNACYSFKLSSLHKIKQASEVQNLLQIVKIRLNCDVAYSINPLYVHTFLSIVMKTANFFYKPNNSFGFVAQ